MSLAGKVHAVLVGLGVFLLMAAAGLTVRLISIEHDVPDELVIAPTSNAPSASRTAGPTTPAPSATPTAPTTTITLATTPPRTTPAPAPTTSTSTVGPAPTWGLVWSDEFNGTTVDGGKWNAANDSFAASDSACPTSRPDNLYVAGGSLTLRALREDATCGGQPRSFTTASISTAGKASFTYGAFEVRAKSPNGATNSLGLWPAFWLSPDDGSGTEFDVVELFGGGGYAAATQAIVASGAQQQSYNTTGGTPADAFHTYRVEWEPGVMRWYVDGVLVWTRDASTTPGFAAAFAKPYHLHLNFQVGGAPGTPDTNTTFPADFQVDYVRVYQR